MNNCQRCRESLYPINPSVSTYNPYTHRYVQSTCSICPDQEEISTKEAPPDYDTAMALNRRIDSFQGELAFTRNKINSILDKKKKETIIIEGGEGTIH